jgi:hypothetical protein
MTKTEKLSHIRETIKSLEKFCIENNIDCQLSFTGGMKWTGRVIYSKNILDGEMSLNEMMLSRQWSGIIFEVTFKDSDKDDNINCMKEIVQYLNEDLRSED